MVVGDGEGEEYLKVMGVKVQKTNSIEFEIY